MSTRIFLNVAAGFLGIALPQGHRLEPDESQSHILPATCHTFPVWGSTRGGSSFSMNERKWKCGDVGPDGRVFWKMSKGREVWTTPEKLEILREKHRIESRKYRQLDPQKFRSQAQNRRAVNPQKNKDQCQKFRIKNPGYTTAKVKQWRRENPEKFAAHWKKAEAKRRSITKDHRGVSADEWSAIKKKFGGRCYYCKTKTKLTQDHVIPVSKGGKHEPSNIVPSCFACNLKKSNKLPEDFAGSIGRLLI